VLDVRPMDRAAVTRFAFVLASMWHDVDFRTLTPAAQRLYLVLLAEPRRSMVGVMPYTPRAWAACSTHTSVGDVEAALAELCDRRYVLVDSLTDELLVRTVVKHDPPRSMGAAATMWRAWQDVASEHLRAAVLAEVPAEVWLLNPLSIPDAVRRERP
jgi:hypothetical protein